MKALRTLLHATTACLVALGHCACSDTDCTTSNTAYVNYGFYSADGTHVAWQTPITVTTAGTDSILVNQESNANAMKLPLSYTSQADTFVIYYNSLDKNRFDSIFVSHQNIPHFISMDCGMGMYHHIDGVRSTDNFIESIEIVNPEITYDATEHIKIYYRSNN